MGAGETSNAEARVWSAMPAEAQGALLGLSRSDLQTLLLAVARARAEAVRPSDVLRRWREDRFVRPAAADPRSLAQVEARLWQLLPAHVDAVELSPVVPLGACSALAPVSQNKVVTTMRLTEVLSDSTNALAIEAAHRRRSRPSTQQVDLAASHRQLRAQAFGPGTDAHFRLFTLVSTARDSGSARTEARLLIQHIRYWQRVLASLLPMAAPQVRFTVLGDPVLRERMTDTVLPAIDEASDTGPAVALVEDPDREGGHGYYTSVAVQVVAQDADREVELGDGGFTTWTAQLLGDAKERCLVSCISVDRIAEIIGRQDNA